MDSQKNTNPEENKPSFLPVSDRNVDPISFFEKDEVFVFVYKKTEKLATALYMVTNLFGESEPMKWTLRKKVGELLSFIIGYKDTALAEYETFTESTQTRVLEIVSLLEISSRSGLVSPMNFSILKKEFSYLLEVLRDSSKTKYSDRSPDLSQTFFDVPRVQNVVRPVPISQTSENIIKDKPVPTTPPVSPVFKRNNRQNIILGLLKKKKDLSIKDISDVIKDCSEKTIQRELIALIENGIIQKIGERRWSRYSLKTPIV